MAQSETTSDRCVTPPVRVGIVGTGYAAKRRAEAIVGDERAHLIAVAGHTQEHTEAFCQTHGAYPLDSWQQLVKEPSLDLVIIATVNSDHGAIARAAIEAGRHVIIEYPLSLDPTEAAAIVQLAEQKGKLLHVEHIELLGGLHQAMSRALPEIGSVFYARYVTLSPQHPVLQRWSYHRQLFGFPLSAALSRIHRFTNLFGSVATVNCQTRFWDGPDPQYYTACLCATQLSFANGPIADITYGKGQVFYKAERTFELHGDAGTLIFEGETGILVRGEEQIPIEVGSRRGLFAKDTALALDYLLEGKPLYVEPNASVYALQIADAARISSETGEIYRCAPQSGSLRDRGL